MSTQIIKHSNLLVVFSHSKLGEKCSKKSFVRTLNTSVFQINVPLKHRQFHKIKAIENQAIIIHMLIYNNRTFIEFLCGIIKSRQGSYLLRDHCKVLSIIYCRLTGLL